MAQAAYEQACREVFSMLDLLEARLGTEGFLFARG
jgi:glutathionyl-hydroquinone reductase